MKKIILVLSLAFLAFSCSDDDDSGSSDCVTCDFFGVESTICDNGDGSYKLTAAGQSEDIEFEEGQTFEDVSTCPETDLDLDDLL